MARAEQTTSDQEETNLVNRFPKSQYPGFAFAYERGHLVYYLNRSTPGRYADNDQQIDRKNPRPCKACNAQWLGATPPCLGTLPGVKYATCGHG
ncbi:MAG TPA: hypothetical protein VF598_10650, partial [Hymenobacter sp.]